MGKKDAWIITFFLCLVLVAFGVSRFADGSKEETTKEHLPESIELEAEAGRATSKPISATVAPSTNGTAYLQVSVQGMRYEPVLLDRETRFTLRQKETGAENVIHVTEDSVWMESSSCQNQDCVDQGVVMLDNRHTRILGNMIICLPNRVMLELIRAEDVGEMLP